MPNIQDIAIGMLRSNPNFKDNELAQSFLEAYDQKDSRKGEELANNIINTYGLDRNTAINQAQNGLGNLLLGMFNRK